MESVETIVLTLSVMANVFFILAWRRACASLRFHRARGDLMRQRWVNALKGNDVE